MHFNSSIFYLHHFSTVDSLCLSHKFSFTIHLYCQCVWVSVKEFSAPVHPMLLLSLISSFSIHFCYHCPTEKNTLPQFWHLFTATISVKPLTLSHTITATWVIFYFQHSPTQPKLIIWPKGHLSLQTMALSCEYKQKTDKDWHTDNGKNRNKRQKKTTN